MMSALAIGLAVLAVIPAHFDSTGNDRAAIEALLATYTQAVSTRNQVLFETLLLDKSIPFSSVPATGWTSGAGTSNYEAFRKAVFEGPPFTQRFKGIRIEQDGNLATVTLVFINTRPQGESWGWKTLQLLKVDGTWKIASEFYTSHKPE
ncbi:MAG: nuclear transport factor 2 family protein [Rhodanobacteraceae bacterium]